MVQSFIAMVFMAAQMFLGSDGKVSVSEPNIQEFGGESPDSDEGDSW